VMVETAPGAGMKVTLRVPKFVPGVRPNMPDYSADADADVPAQAGPAQLNGAEANGVNGTRSGILPMG
jgi:two-component system LytT family sensor kinase